MRVLQIHVAVVDGDLVPETVAFRNHAGGAQVAGMSTDWDRYATPAKTRRGAKKRPPSDFGVISLSVARVRTVPLQRDEHSPIFNDPEDPDVPNNPAHTDVLGPKSKDETGDRRISTEIRNRFQAIAVWEIRPSDPVEERDEP